mmetsp:Transcript_11233/g.22422  ORF Transcript_11233/g.22422 Transcript_11233/m.22422 type:complete len:212 (+) Transcript_11233:1-636(+)
MESTFVREGCRGWVGHMISLLESGRKWERMSKHCRILIASSHSRKMGHNMRIHQSSFKCDRIMLLHLVMMLVLASPCQLVRRGKMQQQQQRRGQRGDQIRWQHLMVVHTMPHSPTALTSEHLGTSNLGRRSQRGLLNHRISSWPIYVLSRWMIIQHWLDSRVHQSSITMILSHQHGSNCRAKNSFIREAHRCLRWRWFQSIRILGLQQSLQ